MLRFIYLALAFISLEIQKNKMSLKKPRKFFGNNRYYNSNPSNNMERFKQKYEKKKALLSYSLAPEKTIIVKYKFHFLHLFVVIGFLVLIKFRNVFLKINSNYLIISTLVLIVIFFIYIYKENKYNPLRKKQTFISISDNGIRVMYKPDPIFFNWVNVSSVKAYSITGRYRKNKRWIEINDTKIQANNLKYNEEELNYLLKVYKLRSENRKIELSPEYENQYLNLNKKQRKEYIL